MITNATTILHSFVLLVKVGTARELVRVAMPRMLKDLRKTLFHMEVHLGILLGTGNKC